MKFQVDVSWTFLGGQVIEAKTADEARDIAEGLPLSSFNGDYLSDSFTVDCVEETEVDDDPVQVIWEGQHGHRCEHNYCAGCCGCERPKEKT